MSDTIQLTSFAPETPKFDPDFPLKITDLARDKLLSAIAAEPEGTFVRVSIKGGGCSGFMQALDFDDVFDPEDDIETSITDGKTHAKVITDVASALYLKDTTLDYASENFKEGFKFVGGDVKRTCGCGASVAY